MRVKSREGGDVAACEGVEEGGDIEVLARDEPQGGGAVGGADDVAPRQAEGGVAGGTAEVGLVDVHAEADDGLLDGGGAELVLDEDAAELTVVPVDVVGPFDAQVFIGIGEEFGQTVGNGEGNAAQEVLAPGGVPGVAALASSGSLVVGHDGNVGLHRVPGVGLEVGVGGVGLFQVYEGDAVAGFHVFGLTFKV